MFSIVFKLYGVRVFGGIDIVDDRFDLTNIFHLGSGWFIVFSIVRPDNVEGSHG